MPRKIEQIEYTRKAKISFESLNNSDQSKVENSIKLLEDFPKDPSNKIYEITGWENTYIMRSTTKLRVIFRHENEKIIIEDIANQRSLNWGKN